MGIKKRIISSVVSGLAMAGVVGSVLGTGVPPAHAYVYPYLGPKISVDQSPSSVPYGQVRITGSNFSPSSSIWFGVKDSVTGSWYGSWTSSDSNGSFVATTTTVPLSSRCHAMVAHADIGQGYTTGAAPDVSFTDICPNVAVSSNPSAQTGPIGFGQVAVSGTGYTPGGHVWYGVQDTTSGTWYGAWVTASGVGSFQAVTTNLPWSSCGHQMRADAADWGTNYTNGLAVPQDQYFTLSCVPTIFVSGSNGAVTGAGYTTNGAVEIILTSWSGFSQPPLNYYTYSPNGSISYTLGFNPQCYTVQAKDLITGRMSQVFTTGCLP